MTDGFGGNKVINTFVAGLITEAGPLTFPQNASLDESNCFLFRKGNRRRRKGVDFESSYTLAPSTGLFDTVIQNKAIGMNLWKSVAGSGNRNFVVIQMNKTLYFYDLSAQALSAGLKSFTVDIGTKLAQGATDVALEPVSITSGKGVCFVVGKRIDPFFIQYSVATDSITVTSANLKIRDFDGLEDGLEPDAEPTVLSIKHDYNLKNQGWSSPGEGISDPLAEYFSAKSVYPPNSKQWFTGKNADDAFSSDLLAKFEAGNTLAPRGRFLVNPFRIDREAVSGVTGLEIVKEDNRPSEVAFFAGRAWYLGVESTNINGHIFFSQVLSDISNIGRCYQQSDPTTEDLSELLPADGGIIVIPEMGTVKGTFVTDKFLVIFADNGVWTISGQGDEAFSANSFAVNQITTVGCVGGDTIVTAGGIPYWWSEDGIYRLITDNASGRLTSQSMTQTTIETFYLEDIPNLSKVYARGVYDAKTKRIFWHYAETAPVGTVDRWKFDKVLLHDISFGAFYSWKVESLVANSPYIVGGMAAPAVVLSEVTNNIVAGAGNDVKDGATNQVTTVVSTTATRTVQDNTYIKWLTVVPSTDSNKWTFSEFSNTAFVDWFTKDSTGINFDSFLLTGYELLGSLRPSQSPWMLFFFERIEAAGATTSAGGCLFTAHWEWSDDSDSGKFTTQQEIYGIKHQLDKSIISTVKGGLPVVVTKIKVRGKGRALSMRFDSVDGKDFNLYGWEHINETNRSI